MTVTLSFFSIARISLLRRISRFVRDHVEAKKEEYEHLSDEESGKAVPNLVMFRLLNTFPRVTAVACHGRTNIVEVAKYLSMACLTATSLEITDANIDLSKLFKPIKAPPKVGRAYHWSASRLQRLVLRDMRMAITGLDVVTISENCCNIRHLDVSGSARLQSATLSQILRALEDLESLAALRCPRLGNDVLEALGSRVARVALGGLPEDYNEAISLEGIEAMHGKLTHVRFEYCTKVGDMAVKEIASRFCPTLVEVAVIRNFYEKVAKISDESIKFLQKCKKLRKLELVHTRRFDDNLALYLSQGYEHLKVLNLTHCPIHVSLELLATGCPYLEELNISGDSWVKR